MDLDHGVPSALPGGDRNSSSNNNARISAAYKRASRKNAPRRFPCEWPGCDKIYSRSEHLQRHVLNHAPKEIFACDEPGCDHKFVRSDLLARHKKRHSSTYIPRSRNNSVADLVASAAAGSSPIPEEASPSMEAGNGYSDPFSSDNRAYAYRTSSGQHQNDQAYVPLPQAYETSYSVPAVTSQAPSIRSQYHTISTHTPAAAPITQSTYTTWGNVSSDVMDTTLLGTPQQSQQRYVTSHSYPTGLVTLHENYAATSDADNGSAENFAMWLFDPQRTKGDHTVAAAPFVENGLESAFNSNLHYDQDSLGSRSQTNLTPPNVVDTSEELLSENRRDDIVGWIQSFLHKQQKHASLMPNLLRGAIHRSIPALTLDLLQSCLRHFWESVSPRMPIIHQPTFSSSNCSVFLLLVMIATGAAQIEVQNAHAPTSEYRALADLIITCVRWEILTTDEASPPINLWVAQALLLVEFYEKMYSTRKLHERANIYHTATLTLLRRGSPLIGQAAADSPPDEHHDLASTFATDSRPSWVRWADTEAMHRAVYGAFMMDILHAAMFGHAADMAPQEIRLPLPCDDSLWAASTPQAFRQAEANLNLNGIPTSEPFLLALKNAIHGMEIKTHPFGRMIIMCGLLSVGWHLRNRETHLKWLELHSSSSATRDHWSRMLLRAFDGWKASFDRALGYTGAAFQVSGRQTGSNGLIESAAVLYHLAHVSLYASIVDCQVFAGAKRLLGRKISSKDYANAVNRMRGWSAQPSTRLVVLHSFKLLRRVLLDDDQPPTWHNHNPHHHERAFPQRLRYSCFGDTDPHRPWSIYYATLCIWSFTRAQRPYRNTLALPASTPAASSSLSSHTKRPASARRAGTSTPGHAAMEFLSRVAALDQIDAATASSLSEGLPDLLDLVSSVLSEARSEILQEAHHRLAVCKELLEQ